MIGKAHVSGSKTFEPSLERFSVPLPSTVQISSVAYFVDSRFFFPQEIETPPE